MEFWRREVGFEVRRRPEGWCRLIVPWHCVNVFVIPLSSHSEVLLFHSMDGIDACDGPRWLLLRKPAVLIYYSDLVFHEDAADSPIFHIA